MTYREYSHYRNDVITSAGLIYLFAVVAESQ